MSSCTYETQIQIDPAMNTGRGTCYSYNTGSLTEMKHDSLPVYQSVNNGRCMGAQEVDQMNIHQPNEMKTHEGGPHQFPVMGWWPNVPYMMPYTWYMPPGYSLQPGATHMASGQPYFYGEPYVHPQQQPTVQPAHQDQHRPCTWQPQPLTQAADPDRKEPPRIPTIPKSMLYDGRGSWQGFYTKFMKFSNMHHWNRTERRDHLRRCLEGESLLYYSSVLEDETISFRDLVTKMQHRFGTKDSPERAVNVPETVNVQETEESRAKEESRATEESQQPPTISADHATTEEVRAKEGSAYQSTEISSAQVTVTITGVTENSLERQLDGCVHQTIARSLTHGRHTLVSTNLAKPLRVQSFTPAQSYTPVHIIGINTATSQEQCSSFSTPHSGSLHTHEPSTGSPKHAESHGFMPYSPALGSNHVERSPAQQPSWPGATCTRSMMNAVTSPTHEQCSCVSTDAHLPLSYASPTSCSSHRHVHPDLSLTDTFSLYLSTNTTQSGSQTVSQFYTRDEAREPDGIQSLHLPLPAHSRTSPQVSPLVTQCYNCDQTRSMDETCAISRRSNSRNRSVLLAGILQSFGQTSLVRTVKDPTTFRGGGVINNIA